MNRNKLKTYAPQARRDFIQAVTDRAGYFGLTAKKAEPVTVTGDLAKIGGRPFPKSVAEQRKALDERVAKNGFEQVMEAVAYTWFNRLVAIRFMELHGYLDHGYRVLSHPEGKPTPEIVEHAEHVELPGLDKQQVIDLKLAGNKEEELYRILLIAQCNVLHDAMPFLFEKINDETELLLPTNLLHSDSLIRTLVNEIEEADWQEVEIIGWLYQFYISEKKDEVIGKVVASEDIPAATQLFTPNWIVKYLVQNTLGRQWLATYPQSSLRQQMEYYIEPAEQTLEVQEQLKAITPTTLNPEELTLLDPACGSGHILVEAYGLFKAIYQERGYRAKDIPALILQKNLFGLEIDDRAAQLASFALMMKARADDRRIFDGEVKPNILAFQDSKGMNAADITHALNAPINKEDVPKEYLFEEIQEEKDGLFSKKAVAEKGHVSQANIGSLVELFENAKTFGSLIQVPPKLAAKLPEIEQRLNDVLKHGDLTQAPARVLKPLLQQAQFLAGRYDAVIANPPYMGSKYYSPTLKTFVHKAYKDAKSDLYSCFIQQNLRLAKANAFVGMLTIPNWMFLSSFETLRNYLFDHHTIDNFIHNGRGVFGSDFGSCAFAIHNSHLSEYRGSFRRLFDKQGSVASNDELSERFATAKTDTPSNAAFAMIPGSPLAYWVSDEVRHIFSTGVPLTHIAEPRQGLATGDNGRFLRFWHEVAFTDIGFHCASVEIAHASKRRWFPCNKGGAFRRWYGNNDVIIRFDKASRDVLKTLGNHLPSESFYFRPGLTWSTLSIGAFSMRLSPLGFVFETKGAMCFPKRDEDTLVLLGFTNSVAVSQFFKTLSPTIDFHEGPFGRLPLKPLDSNDAVTSIVGEAVRYAKQDWDSFETSWDFGSLSTIQQRANTLQQSQEAANSELLARFTRMKELEEENNRLFIEAYGLQDELSPEVPDDQITLSLPDREEDIKRLLSYAIGCMMGRYSLDKPGLIYAHSGNRVFDPSQYKTFRADDDGIVPIFETDWGIQDDAANRIVEFIGVAWLKEHLEENLKFIADSIGPNSGEQPRDTIRRYLANGFYKHHLSMYKKRPIYWLFSSGKQRAFQCLVYLHRYNEGTLSRMRTEYLVKLLGKINSRIESLQGPAEQNGQGGEIGSASSTAQEKKLRKERDTLLKQRAELQAYDEKLRHYTDMRISLDLDDGVKVNYGKFGDLLAEVKSVTGGKDEE